MAEAAGLAVGISRRQKSKGSRFLFVVRDKSKFSEIVNNLDKLNKDLWDVLPPSASSTLAKTSPSYILANVSNHKALQDLQDAQSRASNLVASSAKLKQLQSADAMQAGGTAHRIESLELVGEAFRTQAFYEPPGKAARRVWVEWKHISAELPEGDKAKLVYRAEALCQMISVATQDDFRVPPCCGIYEDKTYHQTHSGDQRIGLVFATPESAGVARSRPYSLREHTVATQKSGPLLGDCFRLAFSPASSFALLHASKWYHKDFGSENVLLFWEDHHEGAKSITDPYITGFGQSRLATDESIEHRARFSDPNKDIYVHPQASSGFKKAYDIYSLGVVLFEIGLWKSLVRKITQAMHKPLEKASADEVKSTMIKNVDVLGCEPGGIYRDVVRTRLTGDFAKGIPEGDEELLAQAIFTDVIVPLISLRA